MEARPLSHHNDEIISDIDLKLAEVTYIDSRAHIEEDTWKEMYTDWEHGLFGDVTLEQLQQTYYRWFRWERGMPDE